MHSRILIAGPWSGAGKTTVTLAILSALKARGLDLAAAKCGPDYVDPQFHREILGISSRNLDPYFLNQADLCAALAAQAEQVTIIEGVMGYYDGVGPEGLASSYQLAVQTKTPVILVVPAKGIYQSLMALISGYKNFKPDSQIKAVIFNQASPRLADRLASFVEQLGLSSLGVLPYAEENYLASGPLGLALKQDKTELRAQLKRLGHLAEENIDLAQLLALAESAPPLGEDALPKAEQHIAGQPLVLAVARDQAFTKIYPENIQVLQQAGFLVRYFSPLRDKALPEATAALYLPGGCPETFAAQLAANQPLRREIRLALRQGLACWAEQGGTAYLYDRLAGEPMVGYLPGEVQVSDHLQNFGYGSLTAKADNLLCRAGERIKCHEFHYYQASDPGQAFQVQKAAGRKAPDTGQAGPRLWASFAQLYLPAYPQLARRMYELASTGVRA